jgi:hypothetical protein
VFVADDLAAWLTGLLADAGRKKLTALVLGTDQERALRQAATTAVQLTAAQLCTAGERVNQLAMVISQVFSEPVPSAPLATYTSTLEALKAGIARQLAILDDTAITGTGESSAEVLGISAGVLASQLTNHLVQEILTRGARGGPLAPLADQLNHDKTYLQGLRIEGMLGQALAELGATPTVATPVAFGQVPAIAPTSRVTISAPHMHWDQASQLSRNGTTDADHFVAYLESGLESYSGEPTSLRKLREDVVHLELLLVHLNQPTGFDASLSFRIARCCIAVIPRLEALIPDAVVLRGPLSLLLDNLGEYTEALRQADSLVMAYDRPPAAHLYIVGRVLLNLCRFDEAAQVFGAVSRSTNLNQPTRFPPPATEEERFLLRTMADVRRLLWIPHYQGDTVTPLKSAPVILRLTSQMGSTYTYEALHRLARVQYDHGRAIRDRKLIEKSLRTLDRARRNGGELVNMFAPLAQYYSARALGTREHLNYLDEAFEMAADLGASGFAHIYLANSRREAAEGANLSAIDSAERALETWMKNSYPRGTAEALLAHAHAHYSVGNRSSLLIAAADSTAAFLIAENVDLAMDETSQQIRRAAVSAIDESEASAVRELVERIRAKVPQMFTKPETNVIVSSVSGLMRELDRLSYWGAVFAKRG